MRSGIPGKNQRKKKRNRMKGRKGRKE